MYWDFSLNIKWHFISTGHLFSHIWQIIADAHKNLKAICSLSEMAKLYFKTKTNFTTLKKMQEAIGVPPKVPACKISSWGRKFKVFLRNKLLCFCLLTMALPVLTSNYSEAIKKNFSFLHSEKYLHSVLPCVQCSKWVLPPLSSPEVLQIDLWSINWDWNIR